MHGAPLPNPEDEGNALDVLGNLAGKDSDPEEKLEQAVRDVVFDAEYRDGFRSYSVPPENMRRLASLVGLDHLLDH